MNSNRQAAKHPSKSATGTSPSSKSRKRSPVFGIARNWWCITATGRIPRTRVLLFSDGNRERVAVWSREAQDDTLVLIPVSHGLFNVVDVRRQGGERRVAAGDDGILFDARGLKILAPEGRNDFLHL